MRTNRLRRWVAGLCAAGALGAAALAAVQTQFVADDIGWVIGVATSFVR